MRELQKVIKACAIAFAILLAVGIISGIASVAFAVVNGVTGHSDREKDNWSTKTVDFSETFTDVKSLNIDNATGELRIKIGEGFKVEAENVSEDFKARVSGDGKLTVSDSHDGFHFLWFNSKGFGNPNSKITIYIPADFVAEDVKLDTGAGSVSMEGLKTDYLYISAGAGNINGSDLVAEEAEIDGGVGSINLSNVNFSDASFDTGVGNLNIDGVLLGKTEVDSGVGEVEFDLQGNVNDYDFDVDAGVGTVRVNGEKLSGDQETNNGAENSIEVDGGVGNVRINIGE